MPTVPEYGGQQAAPSSRSGSSLSFTPVQNAVPDQLVQQGQGMVRTGQALSSIAIDMQQQANQVRVDAALNKARQQVLNLTFDPEQGYKNLAGDQALTRPNDQSLSDEYGARLQTSINDLAGGLGNEAQRRAFMQQANGLVTQFRGGVQQHALDEYRKFSLSTQDGTIKLGVDEAKKNWNNPDMIKTSLESVRAAVVRSGTLRGWSANETTSRMNEVVSGVHISVIDAALQESNPEYALSYLDRYKDQMTADDVLKVRGVITKDVNQRIADGIATNVVGAARTQAQPSDFSRVMAITEQAGASPAPAPAAPGAAPADLNNMKPDQRENFMAQARAQFDLRPGATPGTSVPSSKNGDMATMIKHYSGDPAKAWAAYHWGKAKVDAAIKEHGADWLSKAPEGTREYVTKNMASLGTGAGVSKPTLQDVHDGVRAQVTAKYGATPPAGVLKLALAASTQQFEDLNKAIKADEEAKVTAAMQALAQNGGRFSTLPYAIRSAIPADKIDTVLSFGQKIAKGDDITNPAVYQRLSDADVLRGLSDDQFYQLRGELSESDFKHFSAQRSAALGRNGNKAQEINLSALNSALRDRFQSLGIDPTPKDGSDEAARIGTVKKFVVDSVLAQQKTLGKQLSDAEVVAHLDGLFAKSVTFRTSVLGIGTGTTSQRLLTLRAEDIPDDTRDALIADFRRAGVSEPTSSDLLGAYLRLKSTSKKTTGKPAR